jgi:hypothetical protein
MLRIQILIEYNKILVCSHNKCRKFLLTLPVKLSNLLSRDFIAFKEPKNWFQEINYASLCSLAGRYDNSIPTRFLAPLDCSKIPAQEKPPVPPEANIQLRKH